MKFSVSVILTNKNYNNNNKNLYSYRKKAKYQLAIKSYVTCNIDREVFFACNS